MSQLPDPLKTVSLQVLTGDSQSEIPILDGRGRLVQRGFGKVITGTESPERPVVLTQSMEKPIVFAPTHFAFPAPLAGTSTSHEYHVAAAGQESKKIHVTDGLGSSLFFLVRVWSTNSVSLM
jgi:hypothetical protein